MKYYFTFGSDPAFPYSREEFVEVEAPTIHHACEAFRAQHPNRPGSACLNCSDFYTESDWNQYARQFYKNRAPVERITITVEKLQEAM